MSMTFFIQTGNTSIAVGTTQPVYNRQKKGWVTDIGIFCTADPSHYSVYAVKDTPAAQATVAPTA